MTAITKAWVSIADGAVDPDSPLDTALMTGLRDNLVHLREWLGASYTAGAVQDHNHDGINSALVEIGPNAIRNGSFESDTNGWTTAAYTGGSIAVNTANDMDGAKALAITSTSTTNGGGVATSGEYRSCIGGVRITVQLAYKASAVNISSRARVIWYDDAKAQVSTSDVYSTTSTPTSQAVATTVLAAPATARFYRVELTGGIPGSGSGTGTVYFDGVKAADAPASGATCTYDGSLVETGALPILSGGTVDLGSNRVCSGLRATQLALSYNNGEPSLSQSGGFFYVRGYNIKNT